MAGNKNRFKMKKFVAKNNIECVLIEKPNSNNDQHKNSDMNISISVSTESGSIHIAENNQQVGVFQFYFKKQQTGRVSRFSFDLFIEPSFQNCGLGSAGLEFLEGKIIGYLSKNQNLEEQDCYIETLIGRSDFRSILFYLNRGFKLFPLICDQVCLRKKIQETQKSKNQIKAMSEKGHIQFRKKPPEMILGSRIYLKKHNLDLASEMFKSIMKNKAYLSEFMPWAPLTVKVENSVDWIKTTLEEWERRTLFDYGIFLSKTNEYLGSIGIHTINWNHKRAELGYWICKNHEGQGLISESIQLLEKESQKLGIHRLEIRCSGKNTKSVFVALRNEYILESRMNDEQCVGETYRDTLVFAKILT